jgi:hypothetical protein
LSKTDDLERWAREMRAALDDINALDFGYPVGGQELLPPPDTIPDGVPQALRPRYGVCDGRSSS